MSDENELHVEVALTSELENGCALRVIVEDGKVRAGCGDRRDARVRE